MRLKQDHMEELEIKKSRFLCYVHRSDTLVDAQAFLAHIKKLHPNANHYCSAMILGEQNEIKRSNDDGEPSGTAGVPMLEVLYKQGLQDIVAITVRYFGGIKLGTGGLIRAYGKSVSNTLEQAQFVKRLKLNRYSLIFPYDLIGKIEAILRLHEILILSKEYEEMVHIEFRSSKSIDEEILEVSNGTCCPSFIRNEYIDVDCTKTAD